MKVENLSALDGDAALNVDIAIIGGGPAGLTIARAFFGAKASVLVVESGVLEQETRYEALNAVDIEDGNWDGAQIAYRDNFHRSLTQNWSHKDQPYGVRTRLLGGSTAVWAGKSAAFDAIDYEARPWVANSGWPVDDKVMAPYVDRAGAALNLGPMVFDKQLWEILGCAPPGAMAHFGSMFWQFARSRLDPMSPMRFGAEFLRESAPNVSVLCNATATALHLCPNGRAINAVTVQSLEGRRARISAKIVVLACGGIETPRLMLASRDVQSCGVGNGADLVGRFLIDHPQARIGAFKGEAIDALVRHYGFFNVSVDGRSYPYQHGLKLDEDVQRARGVLNGAVYLMGERAPDDPIDAMKRLIKRRSPSPLKDVWAGVRGGGMMLDALTLKMLQSGATPAFARKAAFAMAKAVNRKFDPAAYRARGLPHKLSALNIDVMLEQAPDRDNRVQLGDRIDRLGLPVARVNWRVGEPARRTLKEVCALYCADLQSRGLPAPTLADWAQAGRWDEAVLIDSAHMMGTTRMGTSPRTGVVDADCKVFGVGNLYVAGGAIFPTSGHANPTLMMVAFALRLADALKLAVNQPQAQGFEVVDAQQSAA